MAETSKEGDAARLSQESQLSLRQDLGTKTRKADVLHTLTSGILGKGARKTKSKKRDDSLVEGDVLEGAEAKTPTLAPVKGLDTDSRDARVVEILYSGDNVPDLYSIIF